MRAETFLKMYRVLEGLLEDKYGNSNSSVVMDYINDPDSEPVRQRLNLCRELRNLLTHNAGSDGEPVCEPSRQMLDDLYAIIAHDQKPRPAKNAATPVEALLTAEMDDPVMPVMQEMTAHGYSHVPILSQNSVRGVFSASCLLAHLSQGGYLNEQTRMRHLGKLLALEGRTSGRYAFAAADASCAEVSAAFEAHSSRNNRLMAIFLTQNGNPSEPLLGMLTPWDVLGKDD